MTDEDRAFIGSLSDREKTVALIYVAARNPELFTEVRVAIESPADLLPEASPREGGPSS